MSVFGNFGAGTGQSGPAANTSAFGANATTGGGFLGATSSGITPATTGGAFGNLSAAASAPTANPFGGGSSATSGAANIFGNKSPAPSTSPAGSGAFGTTSATNTGASSTAMPMPAISGPSSNSLFSGLAKPTESNNNNTEKPAGTSLFGQPGASTGTTVPATSASTSGFFSQFAKPPETNASASSNTLGGLFGAKPSTTQPAATSSTVPSTASTPAGGLFGAKPSTTQPPVAPISTSSTSTPAPPAKGLDFFANTAAKTADKDTSTTAAASAGGLFGAKPTDPKEAATPATSLGGLFGKPSEKKDGSGPTAPTSFSLAPTASTAASGTQSGGIAISVAPPSTLKGKTIEEIVNKWSTDLETHVREFNKFAGEVAVWDRALIENSNTLAALYSHVEAAEREQNDINESLDHIEQQQADLASALVAYEKVAQEILGSQGGGMRALDTGPADTERDKNYMLATDLHTHLDDLSNSLTQMIDSVNGLSLPSIDTSPVDDPMAQIAQILSSHLESLQWIDGAVRDVEGKITEVEQRVKDNGHILPSSSQKSSGRSFGLNR